MNFTVQEIIELMEAIHRNKLGGMKLQQGETSLELEGEKQPQIIAQTGMPAPTIVAAPTPQSETEPAVLSGNVVASPIVGTFYEASGPDKAPFVQVGSKVRKGDVLFIIESMKLMNEVTSEFDGTVSEIFVKNEEGVEFGQPILAIS